jgi:hypothetical protein
LIRPIAAALNAEGARVAISRRRRDSRATTFSTRRAPRIRANFQPLPLLQACLDGSPAGQQRFAREII